MSLSRFVSLTALMTLAGTSVAMAGFQFTAPPARAPQPQAQQPAQSYDPSAYQGQMPVAPAAPVEQMELSPMPMIPAEQALGYQPAPQQQRQDGRLVINPYPLQGASATHGGAGPALDQAMMEQSGQLQAVAAPGSRSGSGAIARAAITSRFDGNPGQQAYAPQDYNAPPSVTPLPGGISTASLPPVEQHHVMPSPAIPVPRAPDAGGFADAVGFGRDLPLALAMTQVVPPEYTFSFASDVDAGASVSWQGGKAWNAVLNDMLATQGLSAAIAGRQVTVQRLR